MVNSATVGKQIRIDRIINSETKKTVIVPIDDSLIFGPFDGLQDIKEKTKQIALGKPDAVIAFSGTVKNSFSYLKGIATIINLTASTVRSCHTRKIIINSVEQAVSLGADAVAVHINISSSFESEMLQNFSVIYRQCELLGIPIVAIMYPRKEIGGQDYNYEDIKSNPQQYAKLVAHTVRVGVDLGADIIKTQFTGDTESFYSVIKASEPIPIVIAGGALLETNKALKMAYDAIVAGAAGVSFGRNVFNRLNSSYYIQALKEIVHFGKTPDQVVTSFGNNLKNDAPIT